MLATVWRHQSYSDGKFEPLANFGRSLTWAYKPKALISSSQISVTNWLKFNLIKSFNGCDDIVISIAVLLPIQQFYITNVMMLVFSIIVMCSYLYSVCLVCCDLKNTYFQEHLSVVASQYNICVMENNNLRYTLYWWPDIIFKKDCRRFFSKLNIFSSIKSCSLSYL